MKEYRHLCLNEREEIALLRSQGLGPASIGRVVGRSTSMISRELKRNGHARGHYSAGHATRQSLARRGRQGVLSGDEALCTFVIERLSEGWSPQCIAAWLKGGNEHFRTISHETIYRFIYAGRNKAARLWCCLLYTSPSPRDKRQSRMPSSA